MRWCHAGSRLHRRPGGHQAHSDSPAIAGRAPGAPAARHRASNAHRHRARSLRRVTHPAGPRSSPVILEVFMKKDGEWGAVRPYSPAGARSTPSLPRPPLQKSIPNSREVQTRAISGWMRRFSGRGADHVEKEFPVGWKAVNLRAIAASDGDPLQIDMVTHQCPHAAHLRALSGDGRRKLTLGFGRV